MNAPLVAYQADKYRGRGELTNLAEIEFVQNGINRIMGTDLDVDGLWGPTTKRQVEAFQRKLDLDVDGRVGVNTMKQLKLVFAALATEHE